MKTNKTLLIVLTLAVALAATPAFAQRGLGVGGALTGQTRVITGSTAGAAVGTQAGANAGASAGANTNVGVHTNTSAQANASGAAKTGAANGQGLGTIVTRIDSNPQLVARVQSMLPSAESIGNAAAGFRNEGQFLAALHASQNLDIPFDDLKAKMTGSDSMSLGDAIRASKPGMSGDEAKEAAKKAERQAKETEKVNASTKTASSTSANTNASTKPSRVTADAEDRIKSSSSASTTTSADKH